MAEPEAAAPAQPITSYPNWWRIAATMVWASPSVKDTEIALRVHRSREQVNRARHDPRWRMAMDEAAGPFVAEIVVAAHRGLIKGWSKGQGTAAAASILRSRGLVPPERLEVTGPGGQSLIPPDVTARIEALVARMGGSVEAPADQAQTGSEAADLESGAAPGV